MRRNAGLGEPSPVPIFIIGMPRSGTTLAEQILASHPNVFRRPRRDRDDFGRAADGAAPRANLRSGSADVGRPISRVRQWAYLDEPGSRRRRSGGRRSPTKMPDNFRMAEASFIWPCPECAHHPPADRDPIDTCLSCFSNLFCRKPRLCLLIWENWAVITRGLRNIDGALARGCCRKASCSRCRYEEVVADLEGHARRIVAHCGLEWDARCLDFHKTARPVRTASASQVRQPIYNSSVGRWRAYEAFLGPLLAELGPALAPIVRTPI